MSQKIMCVNCVHYPGVGVLYENNVCQKTLTHVDPFGCGCEYFCSKIYFDNKTKTKT